MENTAKVTYFFHYNHQTPCSDSSSSLHSSLLSKIEIPWEEKYELFKSNIFEDSETSPGRAFFQTHDLPKDDFFIRK